MRDLSLCTTEVMPARRDGGSTVALCLRLSLDQTSIIWPQLYCEISICYNYLKSSSSIGKKKARMNFS